ncbi:MAG: flagellar hook-length control protein FliK [Negativicutes bacterium]
MEMTVSNEVNVNLPISGASQMSSGSTGSSGTVLQRSTLNPGAFSEKLSVALDKTVQSESVEKKQTEKTKTDDGEGTQLEKTFPGLPFGLIWSSPVHELLVSELNVVKQQGVSNAVAVGSVESQSPLMQYVDGVSVAATSIPPTTIQGIMEKQELNKGAAKQASLIHPKETAVMGLVETMTSVEAINDAERSMVSATTVIPEASRAEGGSNVNSVLTVSNQEAPANMFGTMQTGEERATATNPDVMENFVSSFVNSKEPQKIVPVQVLVDAATMKSPAVSTMTAPVEEKPAESTPNLQLTFVNSKEPQKIVPVQVLVDAATMKSPAVSTVTAPVEEKPAESTPNLQLTFVNSKEPQKIVPVQVLVDAATMKSPAVSTVTAPVEEKPAESTPIPISSVMEVELEQRATSETENGSFKGTLDQSPSDHLQKTLESSDNDPNIMAATPFNRVFNSIDQASVSSVVASQPRQELHDVASQVMDGMVASTDRLKSSQIIVTLKPEHLGEVTVKINVDGDKVTAAFHAASSEVRAILESSLPQLKQEMSQQGWNFDSSGVFDGMQGFLANHQQQQSRDQERQIPQTHRVKQDEYDGILAFTSNGRPQLMSAAAVDYRI